VFEAQEFAAPWVFESIVAKSVFARGRLQEISIHPVWLRYGERLTRSGIPMVAPPARALAILEWLRAASEPYGTEIVVDDGVGHVRAGT
jgi:hypothetical protein